MLKHQQQPLVISLVCPGISFCFKLVVCEIVVLVVGTPEENDGIKNDSAGQKSINPTSLALEAGMVQLTFG